MKTTIEITKKQYKVLINTLGIAGSIYGIMGDMVDKKYKNKSSEIDELTDYVLAYAKEVDALDVVEVFDGKRHIPEKYFDSQMNDIFEYDDFNFWDTLPRELAERDVIEEIGEKKFAELDSIDRIHALYDIEMKYRKEFEKYGVDRLKIVKK